MAKRRVGRFRIEQLVAGAAEPIFVLDAERRLVFVNGACGRLLGRPWEQLRERPCRYHAAADTSESADSLASLGPPPDVFAGRAMAVAAAFFDSNGTRVDRLVHFIPLQDEAGRVHAVLGMVTPEPPVTPTEPSDPIDLHGALLRLRSRLYARFGFDTIIAASPAMSRVLAQARLASQCRAHVLMWGESGTGKSLLARAIHSESAQSDEPFIPLDGALLPAEWLERDLFGAAAGATQSGGSGLIQRIGTGTLFLRNLHRTPRDVQARLADYLARADGESHGTRPTPRCIATSQVDPARLLAQSELREDLYYRLSTLVIALPPLCDRPDDVPLLAQSALEAANGEGDKQIGGFQADAIDALRTYDWPGNVRELIDVVWQSHAACSSSLVGVDDLPSRIRGELGGAFAAGPGSERVDLEATLHEAERKLIERALRRARGNKSLAAELLSISRPRLYRRMVMLGMDGTDTADEPATPLE